MYTTRPAHNLLVFNDGLPICWSVGQPAEIHVSCKKGTEFYLCTLTICIFHQETHTQNPKTKPKKTKWKISEAILVVFLLATRWCRVPTKTDLSLACSSLHHPGWALTAPAFIAQQQRTGISTDSQIATPSCQLPVGTVLKEAITSSIGCFAHW